jgi:inner membrane protein
MASLGHIGIGMAAARLYGDGRRPHVSSMAAWSALSMLPDIDVVGFSLGVRYADPWGHRGATHSFAFAIGVGAAIGLIAARRFRQPIVRTLLFACTVLTTHPLLDTLTDGGLGCALFWPFDLTRYFAPWRPIQVAPIGLGFFTTYGAIVALSEAVLFFPLFAYALRAPWRAPRPIVSASVLAIWLVAAWLIASTDPVRDAAVATILRDRTEYAAGFSEATFAGIAEGQSQTQVRATAGAPLEEGWIYPPPGEGPLDQRAADPNACGAVRFRSDRVSETLSPAACESRGVTIGQSKQDVESLLGPPTDSCWAYSKGRPRRPFRLRLVCFHGANVEMIARRWVF